MAKAAARWEACLGERDAMIRLGLLSHLFLQWDSPITGAAAKEPTHFYGLNIHALVIDNADGEVLAVGRNLIHKYASPVEHAEQITIRGAIARVQQKSPRPGNMTVEEFYRHHLFYSDGKDPSDFVYKGCTLVTTLEPCPMCAATLCACRMKRVAYLVEDTAYGGSWDGRKSRGNGLKSIYYPSYDLMYGMLQNRAETSRLCKDAADLYAPIQSQIDLLQRQNVPATLFFDFMQDKLRQVFSYFSQVTRDSLVTKGSDLARNMKTLRDLKSLCNIPF